ncbi:MAG: adhesin [Candidatus Melainabacteria bacterium HGW-Melainabacteria-1]|nr:MAG: adhesin [Candidatus Melainabacteria bacterium HGW-Melainabacteria-1]
MAKSKVVTSYPYIASLVGEIGKQHVEVSSLANGDWDPHFIVAKPSLLAKLRNARLLVINGAQLEIGWLPPLLRQAANGGIQPGSAGFLELSNHVAMIQKPAQVSRAMGDVHPQGNPHFVLNPDNVPRMAEAISQKLCQLEVNHCAEFKQNQSSFVKRWQQRSTDWARRMAPLKGKSVLEYHRLHDYFLSRYGLKLLGTLEPLPGIPPTPQHLSGSIKLAAGARFNLRGVYNPQDPSNYVSRQSKVPLVTLPHDVGAVPEAKDLFGLFESILSRLGV